MELINNKRIKITVDRNELQIGLGVSIRNTKRFINKWCNLLIVIELLQWYFIIELKWQDKVY